jgi:hypothetical protein
MKLLMTEIGDLPTRRQTQKDLFVVLWITIPFYYVSVTALSHSPEMASAGKIMHLSQTKSTKHKKNDHYFLGQALTIGLVSRPTAPLTPRPRGIFPSIGILSRYLYAAYSQSYYGKLLFMLQASPSSIYLSFKCLAGPLPDPAIGTATRNGGWHER